jgi:CoA-transferase family III
MANDNIFSGLKIVDLSSFIAGPNAAVILSDFGADVIKVEPPAGDLWRIGHKIPPQPQARDPYPWHLANRNKRGMTLDLKNPGSRKVLEKLVKWADVFIVNTPHPALDPGVTAQLECLLDDVVVGKQEMLSAIDAVCDVAQRIIGKLKDGAAAGGPSLLGAAVGNGPAAYPPTPAMNRFADSLARQKGIKPPPGYKTSISICRAFLKEHAPKKAEGETPGKLDAKPVSPAQMLYAKRIAQGKGVVIPEEAKANSAAISAWIFLHSESADGCNARRVPAAPPIGLLGAGSDDTFNTDKRAGITPARSPGSGSNP